MKGTKKARSDPRAFFVRPALTFHERMLTFQAYFLATLFFVAFFAVFLATLCLAAGVFAFAPEAFSVFFGAACSPQPQDPIAHWPSAEQPQTHGAPYVQGAPAAHPHTLAAPAEQAQADLAAPHDPLAEHFADAVTTAAITMAIPNRTVLLLIILLPFLYRSDHRPSVRDNRKGSNKVYYIDDQVNSVCRPPNYPALGPLFPPVSAAATRITLPRAASRCSTVRSSAR